MPKINTSSSASGAISESESATSPKSPFPYSPDSYALPKSITRPMNPESSLLPTNSPTFLVSGAAMEGKSTSFKVPTSPLPDSVGREINAYAERVVGQDEEDENEGLIIFPSYNITPEPSPAMPSTPRFEPHNVDGLADDESTDVSSSSDESELESDASSRSSSPSLEDEDFDCESWTPCSTPPPSTPPFIFAEDDISLHISSQPAHCVDYLAHEWSTDDLWASFKHIRVHGEIRGGKRLQNALWRTWWRDGRDLKKISAGRLHWAKESDITWLYGPFQPSQPSDSTPVIPQSPTKSLLKKHHPAKTMQQRSDYTLTVLREAISYRHPSLPSKAVAAAVAAPPPVVYREEEEAEKFLASDMDALGLKNQQKKRVVFNEIVILYREVIHEPEPEILDADVEWSDFDDDFGGVD